MFLSDANKWLRLYEEGILQAKEALKIYERLNHTSGQAVSWYQLAPLLYYNNELGAAEEAALRAIDLHSDEGDKSLVCECYRVLGQVCHSRGETEKAIGQFETALGIASTLSRHDHLFWNNYSLAELFFSENMFDDAHAYVECAKSHAINSSYLLGRAMGLQANFWYKECRFEEAKSEALRAIDVYEGVGATDGVESCIRDIEDEMKALPIAGEPDLNGAGESLGTAPLPTPVNSIFSWGCWMMTSAPSHTFVQCTFPTVSLPIITSTPSPPPPLFSLENIIFHVCPSMSSSVANYYSIFCCPAARGASNHSQLLSNPTLKSTSSEGKTHRPQTLSQKARGAACGRAKRKKPKASILTRIMAKTQGGSDEVRSRVFRRYPQRKNL